MRHGTVMMSAVFRAAPRLAVVAAVAAAANVSTGRPSCPCIGLDLEARMAEVLNGSRSVLCVEDAECFDSGHGDGTLTICPTGGDCFAAPRTYGLDACAPHDLRDLRRRRRALSEERIAKKIRWKTLRAVPALIRPYTYVVDGGYVVEGPVPNATVPGLQGAYVDLFDEVAARGGFAADYVRVSQPALDAAASPWNACFEDVRDGRADVCLGNLWTTYARLEQASFTTAIATDEFTLLVPRGVKTEATLRDRMKRPFRPFSLRLWLSILGVACTGLVTSYLTLDGALGDESRADRREMANHASREVYGTLMSIMSSGVDSAPDEAGDALAQRFVKGFFGFFVLVATTLYTANLAAMLSDDAAYDLEIDSIAACEAARCSVCVHSQTWAYAAEIFAASPLRRVEGGWTAAANYARLTAGDCDAIMLSYSDYVTLDVNEAQNLDAYQFVGRPAFSYPEALAVADLYQKPVSHYVRQIIEESLYDAYWDKHAGALAADPLAASEAPDSTRESMGVAEMLGPIALSLASLVVALAVHFLRKKERQLERFYSNRASTALKDLEDAERRVRRFSGARPAVAVGAETKAEGAHLDPGAARPPSPTRRRTSAAVVDVHLERMTSPMPVRVSVDPPEEEDASAWMCPGRPL
ncbi:mannosyl-oligosaccharide 1,2-alpha-mannosidase [Aureococcus anophagefferens]|nr:mannosyl-oligosaccharide 1,2-alpha-mannosidase [Aureococcus anophagefferens]